MTCPCKDCEFRRPGCHGSCEPFKTWRSPLDGLREEKRRLREVDEVIADGSRRRNRRWISEQNRRK